MIAIWKNKGQNYRLYFVIPVNMNNFTLELLINFL